MAKKTGHGQRKIRGTKEHAVLKTSTTHSGSVGRSDRCGV